MVSAERPVLLGVLLLVALATGFWLPWTGTPPSALLGLLHKLTALAFVVLSALWVRTAVFQALSPSSAMLLSAAFVVAALALFVSGALLMQPDLPHGAWLWMHRIAALGGVMAAGIAGRVLLVAMR